MFPSKLEAIQFAKILSGIFLFYFIFSNTIELNLHTKHSVALLLSQNSSFLSILLILKKALQFFTLHIKENISF